MNEQEADPESEGMVAMRWGHDTEQYFVGYICNECAMKAAMETDKNAKLKGGICGGGRIAPDFCYDA